MHLPIRYHLLLILLVAAALRFLRLDFQSLWLDELHTVIECDGPDGWTGLFRHLKCCDQHPPLYFILERIFLLLFGNNEIAARSLSVLSGVLGIWAIYLLGSTIYSSRLGLISAWLTALNYFHIYYSQEARSYSLVFLFTCFSFLFLVRQLRQANWKDGLLYALFTAALLYTHYFGLFIYFSQAVILLLFAVRRSKLFLQNSTAISIPFIAVPILYIPWIPQLFSMTSLTSFWLPPIKPWFIVNFFLDFFGNASILIPFLILFLILAAMSMIREARANTIHPTHIILICLIWILTTYLPPYIRSVLVVPMLSSRYAIVTLPAFILIIAYGIETVSYKNLRWFMMAIFSIASFISIIFIQDYYSRVHKTQFRELAAFIASDTHFEYPVFSPITAWHQQHYLDKFGYDQPVYEGDFEQYLTSMQELNKLPGFWLADAHGSRKPSPQLLNKLEGSFVLHYEKDLYDAWAMLYRAKSTGDSSMIILDYHSFSFEKPFNLNGDSIIAIWEDMVQTDPIWLIGADYTLRIKMKGTPVNNVYPKIQVSLNRMLIGNFELANDWQYYELRFKHPTNSNAVFQFKMINDASDGNEDRNAFIKSFQLCGGDC